MSWEQAVARLGSNPDAGGAVNGFYASRREAAQRRGRRWFVLATLKDASAHVFRIAR